MSSIIQFKNFYKRFVQLKKKKNKLYKTLNIKKQLKEKILKMSKTFTVIAGGPRISTSVVSIIGNYNGIIGLGFGRSINKLKARRLSFYKGKKELIHVPLTRNLSIPFYTWARYCASTIKLYPIFNSTGLRIGGTARTILLFAGLKNITAVNLGSTDIFNTANATFLALRLLTKKIEQLVYENNYYKYFFKKYLINSNKFTKF